MFLIHVDDAAPHDPSPASLMDAVRHLRPGASWFHRTAPGCVLVWCTGPGLSPVVVGTPDGSWGLAYGTPSRRGGPLDDAGTLLADWVALLPAERVPAFEEYEGVFAVVTFDAPRRRVRVITDRTGMVPVYWSRAENGGAWVSSSSLAIGCARPVSISREAVACLVRAGFCLSNLSLFDEVKRVGAACALTLEGRRRDETFWWTPRAEPITGKSVRRLAEEVAEERVASLRGRLAGDREIVATLTAGLDSRCVCAMLGHVERPVRYFTGDEGAAWEAAGARRVAEALDLDWFLHEQRLTPERYRDVTLLSALLGDGENQPFRASSYWTAELGGPGKVFLWGLGGETWRDYWSKHEKAAWILKGSDEIERLVNYRVGGCGLPADTLVPRLREDLRGIVVDLFRASYAALPGADKWARLDQLYARERLRRWASVHLMTCRWWAPMELPLVGQSLIDRVYRLPRAAKQSSALMRWVIRRLNPRAALLPHNEGYYSVPTPEATPSDRLRAAVLDAARLGRKLRIVPWMRPGRARAVSPRDADRTYRALFEDVLDPRTMKSLSLYDAPALTRVLDTGLDQPCGRSGAMNFIVGIEAVLRATTRFRAG